VEACIQATNKRLAEIGLELSIGKTEVLTKIQNLSGSEQTAVPKLTSTTMWMGSSCTPKTA